MKGRRPNSIAMTLLHGNPGHRPVPSAGPFVAGIPDKPAGLDVEASEEWDRLVTALDGVLCPASRGMLLVACDSYADMMAADRVLRTHGRTYETVGESGSTMVRTRPEVAMKQQARRSYQLALVELGAAPVRHAQVKRLPPSESATPTGLTLRLGTARFFTP